VPHVPPPCCWYPSVLRLNAAGPEADGDAITGMSRARGLRTTRFGVASTKADNIFVTTLWKTSGPSRFLQLWLVAALPTWNANAPAALPCRPPRTLHLRHGTSYRHQSLPALSGRASTRSKLPGNGKDSNGRRVPCTAITRSGSNMPRMWHSRTDTGGLTPMRA